MIKFANKKLLLSGFALLTLGAVFARPATADMQPAPDATWDSLFGPEEDAAWGSLMFVRGMGGSTTFTKFSKPVGALPGSSTVIKGKDGLIVGVAPPPISPWKP